MLLDTVHTSVEFKTSDSFLANLYGAADVMLKGNVKDFCGRPVLIEGGGYNAIWLETQPMGGEMYAKRNMEAAVNNSLLATKFPELLVVLRLFYGRRRGVMIQKYHYLIRRCDLFAAHFPEGIN